ncbi:hypothetical protein ACGRT8_01065 [Candidatus Phytoplasma australasiaticum]
MKVLKKSNKEKKQKIFNKKHNKTNKRHYKNYKRHDKNIINFDKKLKTLTEIDQRQHGRQLK